MAHPLSFGVTERDARWLVYAFAPIVVAFVAAAVHAEWFPNQVGHLAASCVPANMARFVVLIAWCKSTCEQHDCRIT